MSRAVLTIVGKRDRERAANLIERVAPGTRVEFKGGKRTLDQNSKMWAMLTDIARQVNHNGRKLTADEWKILLIVHFRRHAPDLVVNLDGDGFVDLKHSSSDMSKEEMSQFIELITAWGTERGVKFGDIPPAA